MPDHLLAGVRVVELADEKAEYVGLLLAGLGAEVIKVEPPGGSPTRAIGPFFEDVVDPERSLHFWSYNRGKQSIALDLDQEGDRTEFLQLVGQADVLIDSTPRDYLAQIGLRREDLVARFPRLVLSRMTAFGDDGPWASYRGSDLIHLALGGQMMNSGYSPRPDGTYDLPPMAGQAWHAYHIAGEQLAVGTVAALYYRETSGLGQLVACSIHEAAAKNTELDVTNWVMRRAPIYRQTSQHAAETVAPIPPLVHTKDGRWFLASIDFGRSKPLPAFLAKYGIAGDLGVEADGPEFGARSIPGSSSSTSERHIHMIELTQRLFGRFTYRDAPWREAQEAGLLFVPVRHPEESIDDDHWKKRNTFSEIYHPEHNQSFTYVASKWMSTETEWSTGRRAPMIDEDHGRVSKALHSENTSVLEATKTPATPNRLSPHGKPFALDGVRVFDFSWFLASAGGTRFLAAMGAEVIKVEWAAHPDSRAGVMAPVGGREARNKATSPLAPYDGPENLNMGGQFNNKNAGKRGLSLNVTHPEGHAIARRLISISDVVAEGFSPGVLEKWGLGYDALRELKPDVIYAQQSGMGAHGTYGRFRAVGPVAGAFSGITDASGLPEPALPAGWGYSYLDWIGAYSFGLAILSALHFREKTGKGQWIDASQTETGIFTLGVPILDFSANGRKWERRGNRSPWQLAAPHGAYPCAGVDRWLAIACFTDEDWHALVKVAQHPEWETDRRFATMQARLENQDELDSELASWTCGSDRYELMFALQSSGVAAGVCQTAEDKVDVDPQLAALDWLTEVTGTRIGTWPIAEIPLKMSSTPAHIGGPIGRGAPCYGEDNEYVLGELLGMSSKDIARLAEDGVI